MIATKKSDLRIIEYSVFVHKSNVDETIDEYTKTDETYENPLNDCHAREVTDKEWQDYMDYTLQGTDE